MEASAVGFIVDGGAARQQAAAEAHERLRRALMGKVEAVPCPACGWYQQHMLPLARRMHHRWVRWLGLALVFLLCPVLLLAAYLNYRSPYTPFDSWAWVYRALAAGVAAAAGVFLIAIRWRLGQAYDPNGVDPDVRMAAGRSRALPAHYLHEILFGHTGGQAPPGNGEAGAMAYWLPASSRGRP